MEGRTTAPVGSDEHDIESRNRRDWYRQPVMSDPDKLDRLAHNLRRHRAGTVEPDDPEELARLRRPDA